MTQFLINDKKKIHTLKYKRVGLESAMKRSCLAALLLLLFAFIGCGNNNIRNTSPTVDNSHVSEQKEESKESDFIPVKLYLDFIVETDGGLPNHTITVCVDEKEVDAISNEYYYTKLLDIDAGKHTVGFLLDGEVVANGTQEIDLTADMSLCGCISLQSDELTVSDVHTSNSISDSAIKYEDMVGSPLNLAIEKLNSSHFVNVRYVADGEESIVNPEDWEVISQNINNGAVIDKATAIELTCKKVYYQLYLDFLFDENLLLAKYGLTTKFDDEILDRIPHGTPYTKLLRVREGEHKLVFFKDTDNGVSASKIFTIAGDSTFKATLHTNSKSIEINDSKLLDSIEGASLEVPNVAGMTLDTAILKLSSCGFSNIRKEANADIWMMSNWIVESQSVEAGTSVDKNTCITLKCIKVLDYLTDTYLGLSVSEAEKKAIEKNNNIRFIKYLSDVDFSNEVTGWDENKKGLWKVKQASSESSNLLLYVVYSGNVEMPNLVGKKLSDALASMRSLEFSGVKAEAIDGSLIWDENNWVVKSQSVSAGAKVNADGTITLSVEKPEQQLSTTTTTSTSASTSSKENATIYYSTNDKNTVKNGNKGVYTYKSSGGVYDVYYVIDFDTGWVYFFTDGNDTTQGDKTKIVSGDLNNVLIATYYDGETKWSYGFHFKWKNQPDHLVLQDQDGFEYDYYATSLESALKIMGKRTFSDLSP